MTSLNINFIKSKLLSFSGVLKGEHWFQGRWLLCEVVASMCLTACFCAFLNLTLLTFNRYVFVCWHTWYYRIFKRPVCIFLCVCAWALAFLFEYPNFIGWGDHYFDSKNHQVCLTSIRFMTSEVTCICRLYINLITVSAREN